LVQSVLGGITRRAERYPNLITEILIEWTFLNQAWKTDNPLSFRKAPLKTLRIPNRTPKKTVTHRLHRLEK